MTTYRQSKITVHEVEVTLTRVDFEESARKTWGGLKSMQLESCEWDDDGDGTLGGYDGCVRLRFTQQVSKESVPEKEDPA